MCSMEKGLDWWAEKGLVHVFYPVLDVVSLMCCFGGCELCECARYISGCDR
jgi:hypothetical protein